MEGRAIDVRLRGFPTVKVRDIAIALRRGGVGFYEASDFVHVDTGDARAINDRRGVRPPRLRTATQSEPAWTREPLRFAVSAGHMLRG